MRKANSQYLTNLAVTLIHQLNVPDYLGGLSQGVQEFYARFAKAVKARVLEMTPETRGRIADYGLAFNAANHGKTALYAVHRAAYCGEHESGHSLLVEIASTAIIAEMFDILHQQFHDEVALQINFDARCDLHPETIGSLASAQEG